MPWNKYETAILISACAEYNQKRISKKDAIKMVSDELRQRAIDEGMIIDDVFRNKNGISMQFEIINGLISGTKCGLHNASKLFIEMADMYLNNRVNFMMILKEAKDMDILYAKRMQELFSKWLSKQLSPAQISEIYMTYYNMDEYLQRENLLTMPLLETYDIDKIKKIQEMIDKNRRFKYTHRAKIDKYSMAINLYISWLSENVNVDNKLRDAEYQTKQSYSNGDRNVQSQDIKFVSFTNWQNLAFSKVIYFEYFGIREDNIGSWKCLYQKVLTCLYEDYPSQIMKLCGKCIGIGKRVDIDTSDNVDYMIAPRRFSENLYVETNLNATSIVDKIKYLMDYCMLDYENLTVAYSSKKNKDVSEMYVNNQERVNCNIVENNDLEELIVQKRKGFSQWLNENGQEQGIVLVILMDMSKMNKILFANSIIKKDIYLIDNVFALKMVFDRLQQTDTFLAFDKELQKQYKNTFDMYIKYKTLQSNVLVDKNLNIKDKNKTTERVSTWCVELEKSNCSKDNVKKEYKNDLIFKQEDNSTLTEEQRLLTILDEDFENGYRINSTIDKSRIKHFYSTRYHCELMVSDEKLLYLLKKIGAIRENRIFAKESDEQVDSMKEIYNNVMEAFNWGASCVYLEAVYQKYSVELAEILQIYDWEVLGEQLIKLSRGRLLRKKTFVCLINRKPDLNGDVISLFKNSPLPLSYDDLNEKMWFVPIEKIKHVLMVTKEIVQVAPETYFYSCNLPINQEEIFKIKDLLHQALLNRTHITDVEMRDMINNKCPGVAINTEEFTTYGLRNCLGYMLKDSFSFNGPIISEHGKKISTAEVYAEYCEEREQVTLDELKNISSDMNTGSIYWDAVREKTVRLSEKNFVRNDQVAFDVTQTDHVLDMLCDNDYMPLKDIGLFMHFPPIGVQWNGYVLESYLYNFSQKYKLVHANFSSSGYFGAMVKCESDFKDYQSLITDVLAHSNQWNDMNYALELLVKLGYQKKKKFANIEKVMNEAKIRREKFANK